MKNVLRPIFCASIMALFMTSCQNESSNENIQEIEPVAVINDSNIIPGQYIVVFKETKITPALKLKSKSNFSSRNAKAETIEKVSKNVIKKINTILDKSNVDQSNVLNYYTTEISGVAIKLSDKEYKQLSKNENVDYIEFDRKIELPKVDIENITKANVSQRARQTTPCGINNAGGSTDGSSKRSLIWIIDTGIDLDHPDLNVAVNLGRSFIDRSPDDCNGHGTHVAGTAAAKNNGFGVVGVSAGARVVPIKVLNCNGIGSVSSILAGINYVGRYARPGDVVNMSLGGYTGANCSTRTPYKSAVKTLANSGAYVAIAAGNSSDDASKYGPACINGDRIYTVASMTCNRSFSWFSNYNMNPVDLIATGSDVYSTYLNGGYATLGGTSMAAPHVAGIMHSRGGAPRTSGYVYSRGERYPIAVR